MKKTREQKAITLMALIITIVVLLVLATVAISSIKNDGIISKAQDVTNKFNEAQSNEQGILDEYLSYFEGDAGVPEELEKYILGQNKTGRDFNEIVDESTFSFKDEESTIPNASTDITITGSGMNSDSTKGLLYIQYKEKMYEVIVDISTYYTESIKYLGSSDSETLFEGEFAITKGETTQLPITSTLSMTRKYRLTGTSKGESVTIELGSWFMFGQPVGLLGGIDAGRTVLIDVTTNQISTTIEEYVLNGIYDIGPSDNYVEENGFGAYYVETDYVVGWTLNKTPDTSYIVPTTISGKEISRVQMDLISGEPTFTHDVTLITEAAGRCPSSIKIISTNLDFWFNDIASPIFSNTSIDLTECGDEITFPEDVLSNIASANITIYVTSAVKAKYPDNANIVAK